MTGSGVFEAWESGQRDPGVLLPKTNQVPPNMNRILFPVVLLLAALAPLDAAERRPNVVLILIDDFGYECVTANGGESYRTPVMDRLAASA